MEDEIKIIYLVTGSCGSWSDARSWNVKAFYSENDANEFLSKLEKQAAEIHKNHSYHSIPEEVLRAFPDDNVTKFAFSDGPDYGIEEVELV